MQKKILDIREALVDILVRDGVTTEDILNHITQALKESSTKYIAFTDVDIQKFTLEDRS
jgi:hypothetical protein